MARHDYSPAGHVPEREQPRQRVRREIHLTTIVVTVVICGTVLAGLWLCSVWSLARQGVDVRAMLTFHLSPGDLGQAFAAFVVGLVTIGWGMLWRLLKRSGRTEMLIGRRDQERDELIASLRDAVSQAQVDRAERDAASAHATAVREAAAAVAAQLQSFATPEPELRSVPLPEPIPEPVPAPVGEGLNTGMVTALRANLLPLPEPAVPDEGDALGFTDRLLRGGPVYAAEVFDDTTATGTHVVRPYTTGPVPTPAASWDDIVYGSDHQPRH